MFANTHTRPPRGAHNGPDSYGCRSTVTVPHIPPHTSSTPPQPPQSNKAVARQLRLSLDSYGCRSTVTAVARQLRLSLDSYGCRSTVTAVARQLRLSLDSYGCRSTVTAVARQLRLSLDSYGCRSCCRTHDCAAPVWWPERCAPNPIPSRTRPLNAPAPMVLCLKTRESRSPPDLPSAIPAARNPHSLNHDPKREGRSLTGERPFVVSLAFILPNRHAAAIVA